jgi:hypothetical protein
MSRYIVVANGEIILHAKDKDELTNYIQTKPSNSIEVFQLRYKSEAVLCGVSYEDEFGWAEDKDRADTENE